MKILKITLILSFLLIISITIYSYKIKNKYKRINENIKERKYINESSLPIIDNNKRYIELQTKDWFNKRKNKELCYALLEKDKIVMVKWMEFFKINCPKIHFYAYHNDFNFELLENIVQQNKGKYLVVKISHLQSNYGIIIIKPNEKNLNKIYQKCEFLFKSSFVCNHDRSDGPTNKQIKEGKKESYYKLYETIEPGIIIQDFFFSNIDMNYKKPIEIKILMFGEKIVYIDGPFWTNEERLLLLFEEARKISKFLGSHLIRVDFFVKETDDPYIPYLNEISLSPNGGINKNFFLPQDTLNNFKKEVGNYDLKKYPELDKMLDVAPYRTLEIDRYLSDRDYSRKEKFSF